jgi:hypothetical protein
MVKILVALIRMQRFDDRIGEKEVLKKRLPMQLEELQKNVSTAKNNLEEAKKELNTNLMERDRLELEQESNKEMINKYETQLSMIKTNKEYKALNNEIDKLKEKNSEIDDQLLTLIDQEEELREIEKERKKELKEAEAELDAKEDDLRKKIVAVDKDIEKTRTDRNEIAKTLPKNIVTRYGTLIKNKNRKAVVYLNSNCGCGGCGFSVRPQLLIDIGRKDTIVSCESCGRMIVDKELAEMADE